MNFCLVGRKAKHHKRIDGQTDGEGHILLQKEPFDSMTCRVTGKELKRCGENTQQDWKQLLIANGCIALYNYWPLLVLPILLFFSFANDDTTLDGSASHINLISSYNVFIRRITPLIACQQHLDFRCPIFLQCKCCSVATRPCNSISPCQFIRQSFRRSLQRFFRRSVCPSVRLHRPREIMKH